MDTSVAMVCNELMFGVETASVSAVEQAIAAGANVDEISASAQMPAICLAANRGHADIIKVLIRRGADLEIASGDGWDSERELLLCFRGGLDGVPLKRSRALHAAIYGGKVEALRVLLEAGANPNSTDAGGWTPLIAACGGDGASRPYCDAEYRIDMLHVLLKAGADPTMTTPIGGLAIHFAATIGATQAIELLLNNAPSTMNVMDNDGRTPLTVAASEGHENTVSFLLSAGAHDPAVWKLAGTLYLAVQGNHENVVRILLDQGLEAIGGVLEIPEAMCTAIERGCTGILRLLLDVQGEKRQAIWANHRVYHASHPAYIVFTDETTPGQANAIMAVKSGVPVLHVAARYCSLRAAHVLLSAGADETAVDTQGKRASCVVGDFQAGDKRDAARESGFRRMLRRGPAFRALSWAWKAKSARAIRVPAAVVMSGAGSAQRPPIVRIFRTKAPRLFTQWFARYAVKGDLPFLGFPLTGNS